MKKLAPEYKSPAVTVWTMENKHGEKFDVFKCYATNQWIIDKLFHDGKDWDGIEVYRGEHAKPVSDLMYECGVESLLF